jgi:SAM-dependent methyltransferase
MTERYDSFSAKHYSAFRPPLHSLILGRLIHHNESFQAGLDIGCGTGYSAVALTKYCERVLALDPSQPMLDKAQEHPRITYTRGSGDELSQLPLQAFDIVTFAGSLFYTKTERLRKGLVRVCKPGASVLVYDFEVHLNDLVAEVRANCPQVASDYNAAVNLSDWAEFVAETCSSDRVQLAVSEEEIAHLLLADSKRYDALARCFPEGDVFGSLVNYFRQRSKNVQLDADIYFARYRVSEK